MKIIYDFLLEEHIDKYEQMAFLAGSRQVGKTTIARNLASKSKYSNYLNWNNLDNRKVILANNQKIVKDLPINTLVNVKP